MQTCKTARRHRSCCGYRRHSRHHDIGRGLYDCPVCRRQVLCFRVSRQRTTTVRGATPIASAAPPMVLFNGDTITEYSDIYPGSTVENIKNRQQPDGMPENSGRRQDVREIWQNERESHLRASQVPFPDSAEKESQ